MAKEEEAQKAKELANAKKKKEAEELADRLAKEMEEALKDKEFSDDGEDDDDLVNDEDATDVDDEDEEDWDAFDNNMYEGVDGLEEFEPDFSEEDNEDPTNTDISNWDWEDESANPEKENVRMEDAKGEGMYNEQEIAIIIIFGVAMFFIIAMIICYFFCISDAAPTDASGRKLTRKQRGHTENDVCE